MFEAVRDSRYKLKSNDAQRSRWRCSHVAKRMGQPEALSLLFTGPDQKTSSSSLAFVSSEEIKKSLKSLRLSNGCSKQLWRSPFIFRHGVGEVARAIDKLFHNSPLLHTSHETFLNQIGSLEVLSLATEKSSNSLKVFCDIRDRTLPDRSAVSPHSVWRRGSATMPLATL